jgi:hypothetical protein
MISKIASFQKIFVLFLATACLSVAAEPKIDRIEGAFGLKLGDQFAPEKAVGKAALTDGTPMYQFAPEKPFRSFKRYFVLVTPKTNRIYSIWGIGEFENQPTAEKEQALLLEILKQKYGEKKKEGLMDGLLDLRQIDQGDRYVITKVSGFTNVTLDVRYYDNALTKQAEKERLELEAKKVDSSGL